MSRSSYDELLTQIEGLKSENSHLCRELQDNSSHLTKLENEASNMKDVLSHIHLAMEDQEGGEYKFEDGAFFNEENGAEAPLDANLSNLGDLDQDGLRVGLDSCWTDYPGQTDCCHDDHERKLTNGQLTSMQEIFPMLQELDRERNSLVQEMELEDRHRQKFYEQLEMLSKKLESLPLSETYNLQTDMARRQIEYEAKRLEEAMVEKFGTNEQISQRQEARIQRIRNIDNEMLIMQDRHRQQILLDKMEPSACDLSEKDHNGARVRNAFTNTALCGEVFILKSGAENSGFVSDRAMFNTPGGHILVNIATQTADVVIQENPDILQANLPHSQNLSSIYHGSWPMTKEMSSSDDVSLQSLQQHDLASVMSFNSTNTSSTHSSTSHMNGRNGCQQQQQQQQHQHLGTKVEMVYSLLSMLGTHDKDDMSRTLLAMSSSQDSCIAMRQSGCLPLLIQLLHGSDKDSGLLGNTRGSKSARARAAAALHNIVHSHPDDKRGRREARVLRLLEQIRAHCDQLRGDSSEEEEETKKTGNGASRTSDMDHHPGPAIAALMKLSFDEEHRHAICTLGGLQAIAELMQVDNESHGNTTEQYNVTMRRYACMALTNLTFGDGTNKALLCSMKGALEGLVAQLRSTNEDLCQVAASVLRNLSWRADLASKKTLREVGAVTTLMESAMCVKKESTLKSILSALWNLSAHCTENKADICSVENSLAFLVGTLTYKSPSKTMAIIENGGGVLRNVSSHIAVQENYRKVLRQHGCLQLLLKHLRSTSLTIVSNACGTLWNLSARCTEDQQSLWDLGAVSMLRNLVHSKHKMISMGSAAALKNLLSARPSMMMDLDRQNATNRPGLHARKVRALEQELDQNLAETCDNVESPRNSPTEIVKKESVDVRRFVFTGDGSGIFQNSDGEPRRPLVRGHIYPVSRSASDHSVPGDKICSPQRGVRSGSGDRSPVDGKLRSPHRVARSGSQDSVGSTHSDISHDRTRVHNMLAKSSRLLNGRQGGSLDRNKESLLHRFDHEANGSVIDRTRLGITPNSRIIQVMQEVAMHAGIDPGPQNKESQPLMRNVRDLAYQSAQLNGPYSPQHSLLERFQQQKNIHFVPNSDGDKNINLSDCNEPINYSLKCQNNGVSRGSSNNGSHRASAMVCSLNNGRPQVKVGNYVGQNFVTQRMAGVVHNRFAVPPGGQNHTELLFRSQPNMYGARQRGDCHQNVPQQLGHYAETDLDSMDEQPTNFSLRYAEHTEDVYQDQPINYSMRYEESDPHCADCKLEEARRTNERLDEYMPSFLDDQVKTFYTEGTPYLSTATSLTDLTGKMNIKDDENLKETENSDEMQNFASKYSESEKDDEIGGQRETTVKNNFNLADNGDQTGNHEQSFHMQRDNGLPLDQTKTYCQEGTPVCFSRVSSLSSLHSSEARDSHPDTRQLGLTRIQELDKNEAMTGSVIENISSDRQKESPSKSLQSPGTTGSDVNEKEHKTVTFDENNLIEETPLMFSRCSSLGSLSSFDAQSVHSSVVSEYSRRASEVVSPSELPDSPSETMPPSPKSGRKQMKMDKVIAEDESVEESEDTDSKPTVFSNVKSSETCHVKPINLLSEITCNGLMEAPVVYADEGTPPTFNDGASLLSAITMDEDVNGNKTKSSDDASESSQKFNKSVLQDDKDSSMSEVSEGEEDILAQCISSAMPAPNNSSRKMRKSSSDQAIKKKSGLSKIDNLGTSKSKLPTKVMNKNVDASISSPPSGLKKSPAVVKTKSPKSVSETRIGGTSKVGSSSPGVSRIAVAKRNPSPKMAAQSSGKTNSKSPSKVPLGRFGSPGSKTNDKSKKVLQNASACNRFVPPDDYDTDTIKTYAEEGTPLNFSNATSLSDLSVLEVNETQVASAEKPNRPSLSTNSSQIDDSKSDNSSLCDDNDEILSQLIQAAMPKSKVVRRLDMDRQARQAEARKAKGGQSNSAIGSGKVPMSVPIMKKENPPDILECTVKKPTQSQSFGFEPQRTSSHVTVDNVNDLPLGSNNDTIKTYNDEGTPLNFSNATSLSNLTIDSMDDFNRQRSDLRNVVKSSADNSSVSHVATFGPSGDDSVFQGSYDSPKVYDTEGTPLNFSRSGSLSSLSVISGVSEGKSNPVIKATSARSADVKDESDSSVPKSLERKVVGQSSEESSVILDDMFKAKTFPSEVSGRGGLSAFYDTTGGNDKIYIDSKDEEVSYHLEDTPAAFSRSSSLSELSVESAAFDPTPDEQALLEECISSAMPKSKSSKHAHRSKYDSQPRSKKDKQKQMSKSTSLELQSELGNDYCKDDRKHKEQKFVKMSHSCSDAADVQQVDAILTRESRYSSWKKKQAEQSMDEASEGPRKHQWKRSYSEDSNLSKERKDSANKEIALLGNQKSLHDDAETVGGPHLADKFVNLAGSGITDSYSSEKFDSEKSETDDSYFNIALTGSGLKSGPISQTDERSMEDLMKLSFPKDFVVDTDDDIIEMDENEADDTLASETVDSGESTDVNNTVIYNNVGSDLEGVGLRDCSFEDEITPEDELLLEQNASLIVSELVTNRALNGSTCDDEFIENETLSLISNDYMSDTASEVSVTWSVNSEKLSEYSGSTLSQADGSVASQKGPKIVKPNKNSVMTRMQPNDDEKAIRGRKKLLYSKPSVSPVKPAASKSVAARSVKPPSGANSRSPAGRIPPGGAKKISPKSNLGQRSQSQGPPGNSTPNKPPIKPKLTRPVAGQQRSSSASGIPRSPLTKNTSQTRLPAAKDTNVTKGKVNPTDRPKPIVKQGTFTKTAATVNAPTIENDDKTVGNDSVKMREKRSSSNNRNSGGSSGNSQRGSRGSPPEAWSKALDGFNFVVDKEVGTGPAYKQIQMQRNAKEASPAVKRTVGAAGAAAKKPSNIARPTASPGGAGSRNNLHKTGSASNLKKMGSGSSLTKTSSGSSLAKTNGSSGLVKTSSGTALGKVGSNSNLKKVGSRELKKSESNASIKSDSRPTTPVGRRPSNTSLSGKKEIVPPKGSSFANGDKKTQPGVVGKKQVSSKIAGLWKKDESDFLPINGSKLPVSSAKGGKSSSLPPSVGRGSMSRTAGVKTTGNVYGRSETVEGIKKSSTYDKLSTKTNATSVPLKSKMEDEDIRVVDGMESDHDASTNVFEITMAGDSSRTDLSCFGNETMRSEMSYTRDSSLSCSIDSLDEEMDVNSGGTYKKKKAENNLSLPNADETCRSMPGSVSSVYSDTSLKLKPGKWRRYKDDSTQNGELDPDVWIKQDQKSKSKWKSGKKESKSVAHSITHFFGKKFGSQRNSKDAKKKKEEVKVAETLKPPTKVAGLRNELRTSPSAIVPPFNYSPPVQATANQNTNVQLENKKNDLDTSLKSGITTHATKTEMLLARRRRSYLNSSNQLDQSTSAEDESKRGCLVTTV